MESNTVFECGNPKCAYAIDSADLNTVQLKVLRSTAKRCPAPEGRFVYYYAKPLQG